MGRGRRARLRRGGQALADRGQRRRAAARDHAAAARAAGPAARVDDLGGRPIACGTVLYPILDLTGWTAEGGETHDFESEYVRGLVGALPEHADRYARRSPINHVDKLAGPVLLMQGLEDQVCPPEQADRFVKALDGSGIPHAYLTFEGEQHGFRKADTITAALHAELSFYGQVFGFEPVGHAPAGTAHVRPPQAACRAARSPWSPPPGRCRAGPARQGRGDPALVGARRPPGRARHRPPPAAALPGRRRRRPRGATCSGRGATRRSDAVFCARGGYGSAADGRPARLGRDGRRRTDGVRRVQRHHRAARALVSRLGRDDVVRPDDRRAAVRRRTRRRRNTCGAPCSTRRTCWCSAGLPPRPWCTGSRAG